MKSKRDSISGYRGVFERRLNSFEARIRIKGVLRHLGTFPTAELAALAYDTEWRAFQKWRRKKLPPP